MMMQEIYEAVRIAVNQSLAVAEPGSEEFLDQLIDLLVDAVVISYQNGYVDGSHDLGEAPF